MPMSVPRTFDYSLMLGDKCNHGVRVSNRAPMNCWNLEYVKDSFYELDAAGFVSDNPGWSLTAYESTDCSGAAIGELYPKDSKACRLFPVKARSVSVVPLFNAVW
jgi:hypothetical protein